MADITVSKLITTDSQVRSNDIGVAFETALQKRMDKVEYDMGNFTARVKTIFLNPVVSIKGTLDVQENGNQAKVLITANTKPNGWFWFGVAVGFIPPLTMWFWVLLAVLFFTQRNGCINTLCESMEEVNFNLGQSASAAAPAAIAPVAAAPASSVPSGGRVSVADELVKLKALLDEGILTQEEFDAQKKQLLTYR